MLERIEATLYLPSISCSNQAELPYLTQEKISKIQPCFYLVFTRILRNPAPGNNHVWFPLGFLLDFLLVNNNHGFSPVLDSEKNSFFLDFREAKKLYLVYPWLSAVYENPNPEIIFPALAFYLIQNWIR